MSEKHNSFDYDYQPLVDGKINGAQIKSISVRGCKCLNGEKCDGFHEIRIIDTTDDRLLNFWSKNRNFSIEELEKMNYIDKLVITVDEDQSDNLTNNCELAKRYPYNMIIRGFGFY